jgi:predicted N-acetyltransferase YhbS
VSAEPRPITGRDDLSQFDCGEPSLNEWLRERALDNEKSRASRTFVFANTGVVLGYYCLSLYAIDRALGPGRFTRGQPRMVPVALIGRLAVDLRMAGQGLGSSLLQDAVNRALTIALNAGMRAIVVEALDERAADFYRRHGFESTRGDSLTLYLLVDDAAQTLRP